MVSREVMYKYDLSDYQVDNLLTLANFLESDEIPPPRFNIESFISNEEGDWLSIEEFTPELYTQCGTTACAVGHGPLAGIPISDKDSGWSAYAVRVFGAYGNRFDFMFGGSWVNYDEQNTAKATAKRIKYFLEHGVPNGYVSGYWIQFSHLWMNGVDAQPESV